MKTLKEIFELILEHIYIVEDEHTGMCHILQILLSEGKIDHLEKNLGDEYFNNSINKMKKLYYYNGNVFVKGESIDNGCGRFMFPIGDIEPRVKWLKKQIEKL